MKSIARGSKPVFEKGLGTFFWVADVIQEAGDRVRQLTEKEIRQSPGAIVIKENRHRAIYRVRFPCLNVPLLVKAYRFLTVTRLMKGYVLPYALLEWRHAQEARNRGIPVPETLFLLQKRRGLRNLESFLGYSFLEGSPLLAYLSIKEMLPYYKRLQLLRLAGKFTALLHNKGGVHKDYHAGNLLVLKDISIVLVDLYPLRFVKTVTEKGRIEGLAQLAASLMPIVEKSGIDELLDGYREEAPLSAAAEDAIMARQKELRRRHEASRSKRCLRNSSEFYQLRSPRLRISARREMPRDTLMHLLKAFERQVRDHPETALKNAPESVILKVSAAEVSPVCIKWYRKRGRIDQIKEHLRGGRALRAWKSGNGLLVRGVPVAKPLAMAKTPRGGYLIMEFVGGLDLDWMLFKILALRGAAAWKLKCRLAEVLGHLVGALHQKGVFHVDMKACNIKVIEEKDRLSVKLLDYDYVAFYRALSLKKSLKNLVQLNQSIPKEVSRSLRLRFLRAYVGNFPEAPHEKELFRKVWEASKRLPIIYTTPRGDRMETWLS